MTDWSQSILVALALGEERSVTPVLLSDGLAIETISRVSVKVGDELELQIRCGGPRRLRFSLRARVESRFPAEGGHRIRFVHLQPDHPDLPALAAVARERGIVPVEARPAAAPMDEGLVVKAGELLEAYLLDLDLAQGAAVLDELLAGALTIGTDSPPAVNVHVLLRLGHPEHRPILLSARVVYQGEIAPGRPGVGLALDPLPETLRRDLKHLRESIARR